MRISIPYEIKHAREIESEESARLVEAEKKAEAIVEAGREKAAALTAEHTLLENARQQSEDVLAKAYEDAKGVRADADAYALEVLERLAEQMAVFSRTVENGIQLLQSGSRVEIEPEVFGGQLGSDSVDRAAGQGDGRPEARSDAPSGIGRGRDPGTGALGRASASSGDPALRDARATTAGNRDGGASRLRESRLRDQLPSRSRGSAPASDGPADA